METTLHTSPVKGEVNKLASLCLKRDWPGAVKLLQDIEERPLDPRVWRCDLDSFVAKCAVAVQESEALLALSTTSEYLSEAVEREVASTLVRSSIPHLGWNVARATISAVANGRAKVAAMIQHKLGHEWAILALVEIARKGEDELSSLLRAVESGSCRDLNAWVSGFYARHPSNWVGVQEVFDLDELAPGEVRRLHTTCTGRTSLAAFRKGNSLRFFVKKHGYAVVPDPEGDPRYDDFVLSDRPIWAATVGAEGVVATPYTPTEVVPGGHPRLTDGDNLPAGPGEDHIVRAILRAMREVYG